MLIALLAVLGVDRVAGGEVDGVAAKAKDTEPLLGPYRKPADATVAGSERV